METNARSSVQKIYLKGAVDQDGAVYGISDFGDYIASVYLTDHPEQPLDMAGCRAWNRPLRALCVIGFWAGRGFPNQIGYSVSLRDFWKLGNGASGAKLDLKSLRKDLSEALPEIWDYGYYSDYINSKITPRQFADTLR
jgi:hypothetical protein